MKKILLVLMVTVISFPGFSQDLTKFNLYKPEEDAEKVIAASVKEAKENGKHVFIQVGGNWCIWCARFDDFVTKDPSIDSMIRINFVVYHLNYSKENYNRKILEKYNYPQRFGFPVFLVLDGKGKLIHIQNSAYLEEGKSYSKKLVMEFFSHWTPSALDAANYKEQ